MDRVDWTWNRCPGNVDNSPFIPLSLRGGIGGDPKSVRESTKAKESKEMNEQKRIPSTAIGCGSVASIVAGVVGLLIWLIDKLLNDWTIIR